MEFVMRLGMRLVFGILLAAACSGPLLAQESGPTGNGNAPYFRGKQIRILLSAGVAGGYAEYGRLLTQHLGNHIAGKPDFICRACRAPADCWRRIIFIRRRRRTAPRSG